MVSVAPNHISLRDVAQGLSERQAKVFELVAERRTHKEIAQRLDISISRVSQYVGILKNRFGVATLGDLTAVHRELHPLKNISSDDFHLPQSQPHGEEIARDDRSVFAFSDFTASPQEWFVERHQRVVPEALDGERGTLMRVVYMIAVAIGVPVAVILVITAMSTLSSMISPS